MPTKPFLKKIQLPARRVSVGNTKLEQEDSPAKPREEIHAKRVGIVLGYKVQSDFVDWRNEVATITTPSPIRKYKPLGRMPFNIMTKQPRAIAMSREEAAALQTIIVRGSLTFLDGKLGTLGRVSHLRKVDFRRGLKQGDLN